MNAHSMGASTKPTILVVDDAPDSIALLNQILADDYRVLFALDGKTALLMVQKHLPDVILLDIVLPDMDGYQICRELKKNPNTRDIPVIFVTSRDQDCDQELGFNIGAADYLNKPISPILIKIRIQNQLKIKRSEELILHQALYDSLTGLPNRSLSMERLRFNIVQDLRNHLTTALLFIDLDHFKNINDSLGHQAGDQLLVEAAKRFKQIIREQDTVGRLGGDEFIIIVPALTDREDAKNIAEKVIRQFSHPINLQDQELIVTVSIGIAFSPYDSKDFKSLLSLADTAMYHSKQSGRHTYHLFNEQMNANVQRRLSIEFQLHHALDRGEMEICYQPLVHINSNTIIGAEALLRWHNPEIGDITPDEFIGIAEQTGAIHEIGQFVLTEGCQHFKNLRNQTGSSLFLAINVSPQQFRSEHFIAQIVKILKKTDFPAQQLELEITEGVLLDNQGMINEKLAMLKEYDIALSMDDFGTGYSSLSYLRCFSFNTLKIDRSFITDMIHNKSDQTLVSAIIAMAHALDLNVIAEGVETQRHLDFLKKKNCDIAQGYLFSRPLPFQQFVQLEGIQQL